MKNEMDFKNALAESGKSWRISRSYCRHGEISSIRDPETNGLLTITPNTMKYSTIVKTMLLVVCKPGWNNRGEATKPTIEQDCLAIQKQQRREVNAVIPSHPFHVYSMVRHATRKRYSLIIDGAAQAMGDTKMYPVCTWFLGTLE